MSVWRASSTIQRRSPTSEHGLPGFLNDRGEEDWAMLLDHAETLLFRPGDTVLRAGERDRALYLLVDGWLRAPSGVDPPDHDAGRRRRSWTERRGRSASRR